MAQNAVEKVQKSGLYTVCGRRWEKKGNGVENDGKGWVVVTGEVVGWLWCGCEAQTNGPKTPKKKRKKVALKFKYGR